MIVPARRCHEQPRPAVVTRDRTHVFFQACKFGDQCAPNALQRFRDALKGWIASDQLRDTRFKLALDTLPAFRPKLRKTPRRLISSADLPAPACVQSVQPEPPEPPWPCNEQGGTNPAASTARYREHPTGMILKAVWTWRVSISFAFSLQPSAAILHRRVEPLRQRRRQPQTRWRATAGRRRDCTGR